MIRRIVASRVWQWLRDWLRSPPVTAGTPFRGDPFIPVERAPVVIVDAAGDGAGKALLHGLTAGGGISARLTRRLEMAPRIMLALPAAPERRVDAADDVFVEINRLAGKHVTAPIPSCQMVIVWCVPLAVRATLATPADVGGPEHKPAMWNAAGLLLGTAWQRELAAHAGNELDAVRCRNAQIVELIGADSNSALSGGRIAEFRAELKRLDPQLMHSMCIQVRDTEVKWAALDSVFAAARARFGAPPPTLAWSSQDCRGEDCRGEDCRGED